MKLKIKKKIKSKLEEFEIKIRDAFIDFFVEMFHDYDKYLSFLDEDIVFNKALFMEKIQKMIRNFITNL